MIVDYDIAIIGAGPAGCACALALHSKGLKVALIDKAIFPRDKICGDAIPGHSFKAMDSLNKSWGNLLKTFQDKLDITTTTIFGSKSKSISYKWVLYSYNSKRIDFDNFLFQLVRNETDTITLENKRLQKISTESDYSQLKFQDGSTINASMIIGCDGANSIVKRELIQDIERNNAIIAIRAYYTGVEGVTTGVNECHILKGIDGYFWIFPLKDNWVNAGFSLLNDRKKKEPINLRCILTKIINSPSLIDRFKNAQLVGEIKGVALPIWTKRKPLSGHRFLLCGDAASLVDPLDGHGIDKAIWSGILAAKHATCCFKEGNFSLDFIKQYDVEVHNKFGSELSKKYLLMRCLLKFPFLIPLLFTLNFNQELTKWVIRKMRI